MSPVIAMPAVLEKRYNSAIFLFGSLGHMRKFRSGSSKKTNMLSSLRARGLRAESASTWVLKTRLIEKIPIIFLLPNCWKLQSGSKNVFLKIRSKGPKKLGPFFSLFLIRKPLSSGQKCFLMPYFPPIRDMFAFRSGLRFSFRAVEVP